MDDNYREPLTQKMLDISWGTIIKIVAALGGLYFLFLVRDMLIWFIFAVVISILFNPVINFLKNRLKVPRVLGTILVYFGLFLAIAGFLYLVSISLSEEINAFRENSYEYFNEISGILETFKTGAMEDVSDFITKIGDTVSTANDGGFSAIGVLFGGIASALSVFSIAFFLSLEEDALAKAIVLATPRRHKTKVLQIWKKTQKKISSWFGIRIVCSVFIGAVTTGMCYALDVEYGVVFGLLAGLSNFVIFIGPLVAGLVIFVFIIVSTGVSQGLLFVLVYFIAQEIEGYIIMPVLSKKLLRLSPTLVLLSIMIGGKLWGILGAILAIPMIGMFSEFIRGFLEKKNE
jgi:predicted PurR-regulated permease PerM